ncbi:MAG: DMT family transporter [Reyranella sp.]|uniref:DMT family transporter n=1 Tax=Reyranella sp. TaxID=1929291 RepID=UPI001ACE00AC|nr:DMT family transporter [Reyranella sp.]MBN9091133.1 DMT family transporter [Reyranella sp.]
MSRRWAGELVMSVTILLMGSSYPFAKQVLATMSPLLYSGSRYIVAGLFLLAVLVVTRQPLALQRRDWLPMLVLSIVGVGVFQATWGWGMARTPPSIGSIVMTTTTAFSAILAWIGGRRLPALGWLGIVVAFAGVVIVVNNSLGGVTLQLGNLSGALFWMLSAFAWALYVDRCMPYNARLGNLRVIAWTTLIGGLLLTLLSLGFDSLTEFGRLSTAQWGYWLYTAIFPVGVAFLGLSFGFERLGVSHTMVYMYFMPVAAVALSAVFFGDPLTPARVLGGLTVLLGVILTRVALDRAARLR